MSRRLSRRVFQRFLPLFAGIPLLLLAIQILPEAPASPVAPQAEPGTGHAAPMAHEAESDWARDRDC